MTMARVIPAAIGLLAGVSAACAADYAGEPRTVSHVAVRAAEVWQGHFTGGRAIAPRVAPVAVDWIDITERFASLPDCGRWMRALTRQYSLVEGWKGCLRIR